MRCVAIAVVLGSTALLGQSSPAFEVASVRPTPESVAPGAGGVRIAGAQARFTAVPLKQYIIWAYQVRQQHVIGPDWLNQPKFDLTANLPAGAPVTRVPAMLRAFLVDRFQMKAHSETRLLPTYALAVATDGLEIQPADALRLENPDTKLPDVDAASRATGTGYAVDLGRGSSFVVGTNRIEFTRTTMSMLAEMLSSLTDRPVLDETGLTDLFNVTLDIEPEDYGALRAQGAANAGVTLSPEGYRMLAEARPGALSRALQKAGLTLEARTGPVEVIVVDAIAKTPTEN
jgi:uncharacterized protein (TIGR03435 family)